MRGQRTVSEEDEGLEGFVEEESSIEEFEDHRRNLRDKTAVIEEVTAEGRQVVSINFGLLHGDQTFDKNYTAYEVDTLLEELGYDPKITSVNEIEGDEISVDLENDRWDVSLNMNKNEDEKTETTVNSEEFLESTKWIYTWSTALSLVILCIGGTGFGSTFFSLVLILGLAPVIISGFLFQSIAGKIKHDEGLSTYATAPVTRQAANAYDRTVPVRIFHALTFHFLVGSTD